MSVLVSSGAYTQSPGSNPLATQACDLIDSFLDPVVTPQSGEVAFFLVTGNVGVFERGLGRDSEGSPRPNDSPCP